MLPRLPSARQGPAPPTAVPIGVGIDTSRYGHYAAFLDPDLQTAAPDLEVVESAAGSSVGAGPGAGLWTGAVANEWDREEERLRERLAR